MREQADVHMNQISVVASGKYYYPITDRSKFSLGKSQRVSNCGGATWLSMKLKRITSLIYPLDYHGKGTVILKRLICPLRPLVLDPL